jgi:hypothetical protein
MTEQQMLQKWGYYIGSGGKMGLIGIDAGELTAEASLQWSTQLKFRLIEMQETLATIQQVIDVTDKRYLSDVRRWNYFKAVATSASIGLGIAGIVVFAVGTAGVGVAAIAIAGGLVSIAGAGAEKGRANAKQQSWGNVKNARTGASVGLAAHKVGKGIHEAVVPVVKTGVGMSAQALTFAGGGAGIAMGIYSGYGCYKVHKYVNEKANLVIHANWDETQTLLSFMKDYSELMTIRVFSKEASVAGCSVADTRRLLSGIRGRIKQLLPIVANRKLDQEQNIAYWDELLTRGRR